MKTPSKIFILVLLLLAFLASLAWVGVRHLSQVLHEFDHVAQVDLGLMETATSLNDIQLKKEIIFTKLSSSADELAFGSANSARAQYLTDYVKGLENQFDHYTELTLEQMQKIDAFNDLPGDLRDSFDLMQAQAKEYDSTVKDVFKSVEKGGFQLSLDDLERTDTRQKILTEHVQAVLDQVWGMVHNSISRERHWREQSKLIFWFSLLLTITLGLLLFAFKQNLDELDAQKKDLEKLNKELDRFVHTVSHDIAAPLTIIVGYAAHLEGQYASKLDERGRDCILGVRKGASRLNLLIKDLLELTKMSRVKNPYSRVLIQEIMDAAVAANCEILIRERKAQIKFDSKFHEIICDRIKTTAIFFNLINNALKFAKPNETPVISIGYQETPDFHEFYVKDNGIGIDLKNQQEIFDIFKRLSSSDQYGSGTGVGLTIVKAAVEDQGGEVWVESVLGQGAKFIFTIPKNLTAFKPLY